MSFVRHVIFDLDGTLIDSMPGIARSVDAALLSCGLPPAGCDLRQLVGPPVREILAAVSSVDEPDLLDRLERSFRSSYDSEGWRLTVCHAGVPEMLRQLFTSGVELWMVTNKPALATGRILAELELAGFFRETVCRDSRTPAFASKAEMLADMLQRHGMDRTECLMVGDTVEDWRAAMAAGISSAMVPHGYGDGAFPPGGRRIDGWRELQEMCAPRAYAERENP